MKHPHFNDKLSKFLVYILARQPDEFGLVPDADGYVKIKDLMKALGEEPGWRHVRPNHLREMVNARSTPPVEMTDDLIRAVERARLILPGIPETVPKLLYYPVRQRAYPVILQKGLSSIPSGRRFVMSDEIALAQRLGRRIDPAPVIVTVNTDTARSRGATLWRFGQHLFLSDCLPLGSFSGPPLPKKRAEPQKADMPATQAAPKTPGSYLVDLTPAPGTEPRFKKASRQGKNEWKRDRKRKSRSNPFSWSDE